jgi:hypothetical protein
MNVIFLNNETIDTIVGSYKINRFTFHHLLCILIEESREKLSDQISLYASDLHSKIFFSERGLRERKQKVKFKVIKYVAEKKQPEIEKRPMEEVKVAGFFDGMSDYDR